MKIRRIAKSICAMVTAVAVVAYYSQGGVHVQASTSATGSAVEIEMESVTESASIETATTLEKTEIEFKDESEGKAKSNTSSIGEKEKKSKERDYIVRTKSKDKLSKIKKKYTESTEINDNSEGLLEGNKMVSVELSGAQVDKLEKDENIKYIEKDVIVEGSTKKVSSKTSHAIKNKNKHSKKEKRLNKNNSSDEWNVQMIKAEDVKKNTKNQNEKIKIAILDSGVDCGNDISLAYSISLVPGEEEMTQIFMDGSGHGSSVASLIAAEDNGEGITGINPNAEIYSIRVLDDANQAPLSRVIEGIYMAIEQKVNIINMSFGLDTYSEALEEAIQDATDAGILVVAAAGNTGDDGVQYPAAYDEVLAVGSVDKDGEVAEHSAKGEEVELVAPGELVRTTGFLGTEMVTAGTSLAAPQVSAVASLIWQKDPDVSADFVRDLLNESANLYGDTDSYGNGLVDAEYALEHYEEFKAKYKESEKEEQILGENEQKITTFEDTGCVEGCWSTADHTNMIEANYFNVRYGARFPDIKRDIYGGEENCTFARMTINPWWHGYYKSNYISAAIYATRMGDAIKSNSSIGWKKAVDKAVVPKNYSSDAAKMKADVKQIAWATELNAIKSGNSSAQSQDNNEGFKRAILWGMALHTATDIYAHSVRYEDKYINHDIANGRERADDPGVCTERFEHAKKIATQIFARYKKKESLTVSDLILPESQEPSSYAIYFFYDHVRSASDANVAAGVDNYSYSYSSSSK